jgi:hypothetical protein
MPEASIPTRRRTGWTWEAFERVLRQGGYFQSGLREIEVERMIASHMTVDGNSSGSFSALRTALVELATIA